MYRRPSKRTLRIRLAITYTVMVMAIIALTTFVLLFVLGYRLNSKNQLEQGALIQFNTSPTGATVTIDGVALGGQTATKSTVLAGTHFITMSKPGYDTWTKTVTTPAGTLTWLDYALLIPKNLQTHTVETYKSVAGELASPDQKTIIVQQTADLPVFDLVDITSSTPQSTSITLPDTAYTKPSTATPQTFSLEKWDANGTYVLLKHTYDGTKTEWILFNTKDPSSSKDITTLIGASFSSLVFDGTSGNMLFGLDTDGTIRKIDLGATTLSGPLVSRVTSFSLYDTNVITYIGTDQNNKDVVGIYQDGDTESDVLRTVDSPVGLHIATTRYYNNNYVAISSGTSVSILQGSYPHSAQDSTSLQPFAHFDFTSPVDSMSFSPTGNYLLVQSGASFETYNIEHRYTATSSLKAVTVDRPLEWLTPAYLYADYDGSLTIREFDGNNAHTIASVVPGYEATLSQQQRFMYSIGKDSNGTYILQQTTLIAS